MNKLHHPSSPTVPGELAITQQAELITGSGASRVNFGGIDSVSQQEADGGYLPLDNIPLTRIGDLSYLPMDFKDDFKGMIGPWAQTPYVLEEADGALVMLRPGYNGEFTGLFYSYSRTGALPNSEFRHTDSPYSPPFLGAGEYVAEMVNAASSGFLARIRSKTDIGLSRLFWIEHNGTLDARFHTYLDVTTTYNATLPNDLSSSYQSATYIPSIASFVVLATNGVNKMGMVWYTVNRAFQSSYVSSAAPVLPTKAVNWQEISGNLSGSDSAPIIVDADSVEKRSRYITFINEPATLSAYNLFHSSAGRRRLSYAVAPNGTVRFNILNMSYFSWPPYSSSKTWYISLDYVPAANTLRLTTPSTDLTKYQTLPYVWNAISTAVDTGPVPTTVTPAYKANKYPLCPPESIYTGNNQISLQIVGNRILCSSMGTNQVTRFGIDHYDLNDYPGANSAEKAFHAMGYLATTETLVGRHYYNAIDASVLSKSLACVGFISDTVLRLQSTSQLYGEASQVAKWITATLPSLDQSGLIFHSDSNSYQQCLPPASATRSSWTSPWAVTATIDGNGPMRVHEMSCSSVATTAAAFIKVDVNVAGVPTRTYSVADVALFNSRMDELAQNMISASAYTHSGPVSFVRSLQLLDVNTSNSTALFLASVGFGGNGGVQTEYCVLRLSLAGNTLALGTPFANSIISRIAGTLSSGANIIGPALNPVWENIGTYKHTDGTMYVIAHSPCYVSITGGNSSTTRLIKLSSTGAVVGMKIILNDPTWLTAGSGIHPKYGLYSTQTWNDSGTKARMRYSDKTAIVSSQAERLLASSEELLSSGPLNNLFILSSKSATGFIMYCSDIPVFMNSKVGTIPTQMIDLRNITADPANKKFNFYVQWKDREFSLLGTLDSEPESLTSTYIGSVVTNSQGIASSTLKKVTRIDTYRIDDAAPVEGSSVRTYKMLADVLAYIYDTTSEVTTFRSSNTPPSQATIFDTWDRTSGTDLYFPGGVGATGDAAAWQFATDPDRIIQPNNTATYVSFVSPDSYTDYEFESTMYSAGTDDDIIGVVAAFARVGNTNMQLMVTRSGGGIPHPNTGTPATSWDFGFVFSGGTVTTPAAYTPKLIEATRANASGGSGWNGAYTRVRVVRRGNTIKAYCSAFGSSRTGLTLLNTSELTIDLTAHPELAPFVTQSKYGYTAYSQAGATYYDVAFIGGLDKTRVYDLQTGYVWKYNFATAQWEQTMTSIQSEIGYVREVTNPITNKKYVVTQDGVYKL